MIADSRSFVGATPLAVICADWLPVMIPPTWVVFQLSFDAISTLFLSRISSVGLANASVIPKGMSDGPMARTMIFFFDPVGPWTMNPSIRTSFPAPTGSRVATLLTRPTGTAVAVDVAVAVAVAVGVEVAVAVAVAVAVDVAVAVAVGVDVAVAVAVAVAVGDGV